MKVLKTIIAGYIVICLLTSVVQAGSRTPRGGHCGHGGNGCGRVDFLPTDPISPHSVGRINRSPILKLT